jgi:hypothetical protein
MFVKIIKNTPWNEVPRRAPKNMACFLTDYRRIVKNTPWNVVPRWGTRICGEHGGGTWVPGGAPAVRGGTKGAPQGHPVWLHPIIYEVPAVAPRVPGTAPAPGHRAHPVPRTWHQRCLAGHLQNTRFFWNNCIKSSKTHQYFAVFFVFKTLNKLIQK